MNRVQSLDGLRTVAIAFVVLSGHLITTLLLARCESRRIIMVVLGVLIVVSSVVDGILYEPRGVFAVARFGRTFVIPPARPRPGVTIEGHQGSRHHVTSPVGDRRESVGDGGHRTS